MPITTKSMHIAVNTVQHESLIYFYALNLQHTKYSIPFYFQLAFLMLTSNQPKYLFILALYTLVLLPSCLLKFSQQRLYVQYLCRNTNSLNENTAHKCTPIP